MIYGHPKWLPNIYNKSWASDSNNVRTDCWPNTWYKFTFGHCICRQVCWERGNIHCVRTLGRMHTILVTSPRRWLRGIVFTRSVCVSVCPADILVFYFSAIRRDIDLKCMQHTYRVVLNSQKQIDLQRSRWQGRYIAFWRYSHITKTEP